MANTYAKKIWDHAGLPERFLDYLHLDERPDPVVNSSFKLGTVAQTTIGLSALSAAYLYKLQTGNLQDVFVDSRHAIIEFKSENYWLLNNEKPGGDLFDELAGIYRTKDGFVRIHTNFPHHKQGILDLLHCQATRDSIQAALFRWNAQEFEDQAAQRNMCATKFRTFEEWDKHPHALAIKSTPPVELVKIAEAPKRKIKHDISSPLDGIQILDLTRVLAGPVAGRTLAAHGADVLLITSPHLPDLPFLDKDTSRGKRTTQLDLRSEDERNSLRKLTEQTDVFLQAYRPGGLSEKGFGVQDLAQTRPGIVYASLTAYGWEGIWENRRGFDSLVQNATGFGHAEARAYQIFKGEEDANFTPKPLPCQAIDHAAGYLLAFGINAALSRTITEGGSWEVRVSLAAVAQWIRSLGQIDPHVAFKEGLALPGSAIPWPDELSLLSVNLQQFRPDSDVLEDGAPTMNMTAVSHAARLTLTPVREGEPPLRLNAHKARWLHKG